MSKVTWRKMFEEVFADTGDTFETTKITLSQEELDVEFDDGYGGTNGKPFTAWSKKFVYFPAQYDGAEWIAYVSRNPNGKATDHIGGG